MLLRKGFKPLLMKVSRLLKRPKQALLRNVGKNNNCQFSAPLILKVYSTAGLEKKK